MKRTGRRFEDLAVYVAFGEIHHPAMYWSPGNFTPVPPRGSTSPFTTGVQGAGGVRGAPTRAFKEMYSENNGLCRFHRGWSKRLLPRLLEEAWGIKADYDGHCRRILGR